MTVGYQRPCDAPISASWQSHRNRNPPSSEPGTDYACAYGTPLYCAEAGRVAAVDWDNGGGEGRVVDVYLDDGRRVRYLHLAAPAVSVNQRVGRGQYLGTSGASGKGSDYGYGAHVHVSLWERPGLPYNQTIDFENYIGGGEEEDMTPEQDARLQNIENYLRVPGAGYGWPQVAGQAAQNAEAGIGSVNARLTVPGAGYDWLPAINNNVASLWAPIRAAAIASVLVVLAVAFWVGGKRRVE